MRVTAVFTALLVATPVVPARGANYCGWSSAAAGSCRVACPGGEDVECPGGQTCYAGVECTGSAAKGYSARSGGKQSASPRGVNKLRGASAPGPRPSALDGMACVTGGCVASDTCNGTYADVDTSCDEPDSYVCERSLPGLNVCQSPPLTAMSPCWMASIDGSLSLSQISIPGTHDTMAQGGSACHQSGVGNYVHTQTWSLRTMLDTGVRALDIRLRHVDDEFILEHGFVTLPFAFNPDVRDVLASFLADNPNETVLIFYQVNDLGPNTRTWQETLQASMDEVPEIWMTGSTVPTLDDARGTIVLANDMLRVEQNEFQQSWSTIGDKKSLIREFYEEGEPQSDLLRLNYLSGTGLSMLPLTVAAGVQCVYPGTNAIVFEFEAGCLGITMMDFIGEDVIAHIVEQQGLEAPLWTSA